MGVGFKCVLKLPVPTLPPLPVCVFLRPLAIIHHASGERQKKKTVLHFKHRRYEYENLPGSVLMSDAGSTSLLHIPASSINIDYKKVNKEILKSAPPSEPTRKCIYWNVSWTNDLACFNLQQAPVTLLH